MIIHPEKISGTPSTGTLTLTTNIIDGIIGEILCKPVTGSTTYNIEIQNSDGLAIYDNDSLTGNLIDEVVIPATGVHTILITSASVDELFQIHLVMED